MIATVHIARDLLREAASRKWFLVLGVAVTLVLTTIGLSLQMEVVDGALAGTRLFGEVLDTTIRSADVALRPVFMAAAAIVFYGGNIFMILACSDFAPSLLSPGRIEHLLSLPVRRWELLLGTYLGVLFLALVCALYGAGGLALILGVKTGVWTWAPVIAALLAVANFATIYAAMITLSLFARSTALGAAAGGLLFVGGIVAGFRQQLSTLFDDGFGRRVFELATLLVPRVSQLGRSAIQVAGSRDVDVQGIGSLLAGFGVFALGVLAIGAWRFEERDF